MDDEVKMYKFECRPNEKIFLITMSGYITKEEGSRYIAEFNENVKTFNKSEYYVVVDTSELKSDGKNSLNDLKEFIQNLISSISISFKGKYNIVSKNEKLLQLLNK